MEGHAATDLGGVNVLAVAVVFEGLDEQRRRRSDLAPILQLAGYFLDFSRISPELYLPTTARLPLKPMRSGRAIWWRRGRSARLPVCMATGPAPERGQAGRSRRCVVRGGPALGRVAAFQQGPSRHFRFPAPH